MLLHLSRTPRTVRITLRSARLNPITPILRLTSLPKLYRLGAARGSIFYDFSETLFHYQPSRF
jgi:hypothetical protein